MQVSTVTSSRSASSILANLLMVVSAEYTFCTPYLEKKQKLGDNGHVSKVAKFSESTLSGNLNLHLHEKHDISTNSEVKTNKILSYLKK